MTLNFDLNSVNVVVRKMNRKSYSIKLNNHSEIELKVPLSFTEKNVNEILDKHKKWIQKNINQYSQEKLNLIEDIKNLNKIIFLGKEYSLRYNNSIDYQGKSYKIVENNFYIRDSKNVQNKIKKLFKENLHDSLITIYNTVSELKKFKIQKIKMSNASKRWGSCSSNGNINISWRLMMAPLDVIYSVFAHELVHTKVFNHSPKFYSLLYEIDENYKNSNVWLKENGFILNLYK